jgi:hypothetical protein
MSTIFYQILKAFKRYFYFIIVKHCICVVEDTSNLKKKKEISTYSTPKRWRDLQTKKLLLLLAKYSQTHFKCLTYNFKRLLYKFNNIYRMLPFLVGILYSIISIKKKSLDSFNHSLWLTNNLFSYLDGRKTTKMNNLIIAHCQCCLLVV